MKNINVINRSLALQYTIQMIQSPREAVFVTRTKNFWDATLLTAELCREGRECGPDEHGRRHGAHLGGILGLHRLSPAAATEGLSGRWRAPTSSSADAGADHTLKNIDGETALDLARDFNQNDCVPVLEKWIKNALSHLPLPEKREHNPMS